MSDTQRNPRFHALLREIAEIHDAKSNDYSEDADPLSNFRKCESFGIPAWKGVLVRLSDKWSRLEQLAGGKDPKNESMRDTLIDNAVYSLLCILLMEDEARAPCKQCGEYRNEQGLCGCLSQWKSAVQVPDQDERAMMQIGPPDPAVVTPIPMCACVVKALDQGDGFA